MLAIVGAVAIAGLWTISGRFLPMFGQLLVHEDALERVEVIIVSQAAGAADALEAARLYNEGYGAEVVMPASSPNALGPQIRDLGIPFLDEGQLATEILARAGVPRAAFLVLPGSADGTDSEITAVAAFARERNPASVLFVTARSHTARARWLLQRALPPTTRLLVRAPRTDSFQAGAWWRSRANTREAFTEYLRWFNTSVLGDPWAETSTRPAEDGQAS
jgi:uncharacterized SAM-binding protein YcdF (DUF218 family)